jgi:hypothetical protein
MHHSSKQDNNTRKAKEQEVEKCFIEEMTSPTKEGTSF